MSYKGGEVDDLERGVGVSIAAWRWRVEADLLDEEAERFEKLAETARDQARWGLRDGNTDRARTQEGRAGGMSDAAAALRTDASARRQKANELDSRAGS